jgi:protein tyrosine/serine phosphatase
MKANLLKTCLVLWLILAWVGAVQAEARPDKCTQPLDLAGVPNLFKVSDRLYRSAQPTAAGMRHLKKFGIETIVNLRSFHSDRDEIGNTGLAYEHIYMKAWHPEEEDIVRFLQIVTNLKRTPVLVHCQHGADRTGTMVASYRIVVQGWTKEEAIREMVSGGYGFHGIWQDLLQWINRVNIDEIKRKMKLPGSKE